MPSSRTNSVAEMFFHFIEEFVSVLRKGTDALLKWIDDLFEAIKKWVDDVMEKTSKGLVGGYWKAYQGKKLQPLVKPNQARSLYGNAGAIVVKSVDSIVVKSVDNEVNKLISIAQSNNQLRSKVMVSGMIHKNGSKAYTGINFSSKEIGSLSSNGKKFIDAKGNNSVYQEFIDYMHPTRKNRYNIHLEEMRKGLNASDDDIARAGKPASHGEIRALDALLKDIDPNAKLGDEVFKDILGYNRFLRSGANMIQPPCAHCFYLTDFVIFIGIK